MTWQYLAGFVDGEGWIGYSVGIRSPRIDIGQAEQEVLHEIVYFLAHSGISARFLRCSLKDRRTALGRKTFYRVLIQGSRNVIPTLKGLLPYLRTKKRVAAQDIIRFDKLFPSIPMKRRNTSRSKREPWLC